jgi:two-component system, OmpR family, sensor histidine kinase SenX3
VPTTPRTTAVLGLSHSQEILILIGVAVLVVVAIWVAALLGRRSGRRAISQRLAALGTRLGLDPPDDEYNIETSLAYLEQVTGGAAQAVTESSSDAIRLRRSLDTLTQGVVLCDENGTVIYRNGRANALMVSRHGDALAAQAVTEVLEDAWHDGSAERTLDLYGPPRRTLQVRAQQIDDGRRPLGVIALIEDVSERRRLEEIRRDFVANVSHELKTPMGALGLLAETLVSEPDPEVAQRLAGRIHNEAFRVSRIIDDLLDLSRIESEEAPPREPVLVNLVMADAIERVRATADQRGIEIVLHEPSPPVAVMGDRRQLVSAMHALLENAITYSYDDSKVVVSGTVQRVNPNPSHPSGHGGELGLEVDLGSGEVRLGDRERAWDETRQAQGREQERGQGKGRGGDTAASDTGDVEEPMPPTPAEGTVVDAGSAEGLVERAGTDEGAGDGEDGAAGAGPVEPVFTPEILDNFTSPAETPAAAGTTVPPVSSAAGLGGGAGGAGGAAFEADAVAVTETTSSIPNWRIEERDNVRISVQDHGVGIPARDLDRIFERFYRVDHGRSRDTGGTGLGLSIVRHVANNHQGWVDVESREGEGSTFTLVLPVQGQGERVV